MSILNILNQTFQDKSLSLVKISTNVDSIIRRLETNFKNNDNIEKNEHLSKFLTQFDFIEEKYLNHKVSGPFNQEILKKLCMEIANFALESLKERFPSQRIIENFDIFDMERIKEGNYEYLKNCEFKLKKLLEFYYPLSLQNLIKKDRIFNEWSTFIDAAKNEEKMKFLDGSQLEQSFLLQSDRWKGRIELYERGATIPLNSCECKH